MSIEIFFRNVQGLLEKLSHLFFVSFSRNRKLNIRNRISNAQNTIWPNCSTATTKQKTNKNQQIIIIKIIKSNKFLCYYKQQQQKSALSLVFTFFLKFAFSLRNKTKSKRVKIQLKHNQFKVLNLHKYFVCVVVGAFKSLFIITRLFF